MHPAHIEIDDRLRSELGLSFAPTVFTLLAEHGRYLTAALDAFFANGLPDVDDHVARTRAIAQTAAGALVAQPIGAGSQGPEMLALFDRYNEVNARSLLVTTPLARDLAPASGVMEPPLPEPPGADDVLADVRACHGNFNLPGFWRELAAGWPARVDEAWSLVRRLPPAREFGEARGAVLSLALRTTAGRAGPSPADVGCGREDADEIDRILRWYQVVIATMIIEIECLRHAVALGGAAVEG